MNFVSYDQHNQLLCTWSNDSSRILWPLYPLTSKFQKNPNSQWITQPFFVIWWQLVVLPIVWKPLLNGHPGEKGMGANQVPVGSVFVCVTGFRLVALLWRVVCGLAVFVSCRTFLRLFLIFAGNNSIGNNNRTEWVHTSQDSISGWLSTDLCWWWPVSR